MSMLSAWSPFFQSSAKMRGRAYLNADRVQRVEPEDGELVRALVQGSEQYVVTIRRDGSRAEAECTCPHFEKGVYCKHIWATLLDVQQNPAGPGATAEAIAGLRVRAPKARKRDGNGRRPPRPAEPEWIGRLSLLRPPTYEMDPAADAGLPTQRQLCYVVLPEASMRHQGLVVTLRQRTALATGWSKPRPMKLGPDALVHLPDPIDRELCALLLGARQLDTEPGGVVYAGNLRAHSTFCLPPGAWRTLLKRMIDTGHCLLDVDEESSSSDEIPLRWDDGGTWSLWMVGQEEVDELLVTVELRRGEQRLPIDEPAVVLGGPDGLVIWQDRVAPFDDRDAYRWVMQFRDEHRRTDRARPIRVPVGDVERFLDRLYMLPQIPEIDLPEGIGRVPRHVEPVPHLELFAPDSPEASQALPASAKNQLLARVWFDYDGQRVSPGQPGRFVTIASAASMPGAAPDEPRPAHVSEAEPETPAELEAATDDEARGYAPAATTETDTDAEANTDPEAAPRSPHAREADPADAPPPQGDLIRRHRRLERDAMATLAAQGFRPVSSAGPDSLALPVRQMPATVANLLARGWQVHADRKAIRMPGSPAFSIRSGIDWFELRGGIRYTDAHGREQEVPLPQILQALRNGEQLIPLGDGSHGLLPEVWLEEHGLLTTLGQVQKDHLRFTASQAALLDALLQEQELVRVDDTFAKARQRLREFRGIEPVEPDPAFMGTLRPYQKMGLGWMAFLRWFGMGGILADDMGLGKTIQVLAMLQSRRRELAQDEATEHAPSLVVAPRSVVFNWIDEARRFTPDLRVQAYTGAERDTLRDAFAQQDLIVTSYGLLRRDIEQLREHTFDYVILDEAQAIKNPTSLGAKAARLLQARHRLALTGTPVENHLGDLWSIFEFLNPGMLGSSARFGELVRASAADRQGQVEKETVEQVGKALRPFILRRTKKQVLDDLPEKTEQTIVCEMDGEQRKIYDELRGYYRQHLFSRLEQAAGAGADGNGHGSVTGLLGGKAGFMVLEALLRLRQAACHPALIQKDQPDLPSAKLDVLMDLLGDVIEEGSKALIFSQFTSMLALVRRALDERGIRYCYLDGQTRDRRGVVHRFQNDPSVPVFLISLKTGGFGLNLTAAEYVFILDPWWNPAVEQQAIDRTHRIGQTQRVFAYRLICQDTVEQRIIDLQQRKRQIADAIVGGEQNVLKSLTREDLEQLLS